MAKLKQATRTLSLELMGVEGDAKAARAAWHDVRRDCQRIANGVTHWLIAWHHRHGTGEKIRAYLDIPKEERGKPDVVLVPKAEACEQAGVLNPYLEAARRYPHLRADLISILTKTATDAWRKTPGQNRLPGWWQILMGQREPIFWTDRSAVPLKSSQFTVVPPANPKDPWKVDFTLGSGRKPVRYVVNLRSLGRGMHSQISILRKIFRGDYQLCRGGLVWSKGKGKWFFQVSYKMPAERHSVDAERIAIVAPGKTAPFWLLLPPAKEKRRFWVGGRVVLKLVKHKRRTVLFNRRGRQAAYKFAGPNAKGHGRERAQTWWPLQQTWNRLVKTISEQTMTWCIRRAIDAGCGTIIYYQPTQAHGERFALASVGKEDFSPREHENSPGWPWETTGRLLSQLAEKQGIAVEVRKIGESSARAAKQGGKGRRRSQAKEDGGKAFPAA